MDNNTTHLSGAAAARTTFYTVAETARLLRWIGDDLRAIREEAFPRSVSARATSSLRAVEQMAEQAAQTGAVSTWRRSRPRGGSAARWPG